MVDLDVIMQSLLDSVPGAVGVALVDSTSGMSLAHAIQPFMGLAPKASQLLPPVTQTSSEPWLTPSAIWVLPMKLTTL